MASFKVRIENIVASTNLNVDIPLSVMASKFKEAEYEPEQFPGLVFRMEKPRAASLIFGSGKIVCTGTRSMNDLRLAFKKIISAIKKTVKKMPKTYKIQVENIVASSKLNATLNLNKVAFNLENSEYEPEQFPGLVYRMENPKVAFLLFTSGKIICTGARNINDVRTAIKKMYINLKKIDAIIK